MSIELTEEAEQRLGSVLAGKWRLERALGSGGMANVYAATHVNNGRTAAIKVLRPELALNAEVRSRFAREGYIANKVRHPGAVGVLDDGVDSDGSAYLVMDLLVGRSLHAKVASARGGILDESEVLSIADSVLDVLAAAHAEGIIHRDLKPDNIFIMSDGVVRVLDFGIARLVEQPNGEHATKTGLMIGTPEYMPPEQARGHSKTVDARSDIWALGAIMFKTLTGRRVHDGETPAEALLRAMTAQAPPLASIVPSVSPAIAAIVDRALAADPEARWQDALAMQKAVRDARGGAAKRVRVVARKRRLRIAVALAALAVGGSAMAASVYAPAKLHDVADTVKSIAPMLVSLDAGAMPTSDAATRASASVSPSHAAPAPRPKPSPRPRKMR